jgi:hypothetical protein
MVHFSVLGASAASLVVAVHGLVQRLVHSVAQVQGLGVAILSFGHGQTMHAMLLLMLLVLLLLFLLQLVRVSVHMTG